MCFNELYQQYHPDTINKGLYMKYYTRQIKKYLKGDVIFSENSACDGMYIIDSGRVRVYKTVGVGNAKKEVELCTLGPKAMFGEMAMIDENKRSATVQAIEPTACTVISKKIFEDQLARIPPWMVNMIKILVLRLRETNEKLRKIIEEQTNMKVENDDVEILTVDEDKAKKEETPLASHASNKHYKSEEIIESLFEDDTIKQ